MKNLIKLESLIDLSAELNKCNSATDIVHLTKLSLIGKLRFMRSGTVYNNTLFPKAENDIMSLTQSVFDVIKTEDCLLELTQNKEQFNELISLGYDFALPISNEKTVLSIILLGGRIGKTEISADELKYAKLVSMICASALINLQNKFDLLNEKNKALKNNLLISTLFEMSKDFSLLLKRDEILKMLSNYLMGHLLVNKFALMMFENESLNSVINRFDTDFSLNKKEYAYFSLDPVHIDDLTNESLKIELKQIGIKLIAPIKISGNFKGLLFLGKRLNGDDFISENISFIEALGFSSGSALENERLIKEEIKKRQLERDMATALDIQLNLLPKNDIKSNNYFISGISKPSRYVGGDYYDYIDIGNGRFIIIIADVSGKGLPASLIMANLQAALRVLAPTDISLKKLVSSINDLLYHNTSSEKFVTAFFSILDTNTGYFEYINAGHNPPLLIKKDGTNLELSEGGLLLGFTDMPFEYESGNIVLEEGDYIVEFTDGINEALDENANEYGDDRLLNISLANKDKSAREIMENIIFDLDKFVGKEDQYDDITLVIIKNN